MSFRVKWRAGGRASSKSFPVAAFGGGARAEKGAERAANAYDSEVRQQLMATGVVVQARGAQLLANSWRDWFSEGVGRWTLDTQEVYATMLDLHIIPRIGGRQLAALRPTDVEKWIREMQEDGVGPSAIAKAVTVLSSLLSHCVRADLIDSNPVRVSRKASAPRVRRPMKITPLQVEQLRAWFLAEGLVGDATLVSLLAYAGLRPESEALVMDWRQIGPKLLTVPPGRKRGARERHVALLAPLADDLRRWQRSSGRIGGLVVPFGAGGVSGFGRAWEPGEWDRWRGDFHAVTVAGERVRRPRGRWTRAALAVGLPEGTIPRDLRGSFASLLIWEGRSVVDVARQLGHKASTCLDVYSGEFEAFSPTDRRPALEVIAEAREMVHGTDRAQA